MTIDDARSVLMTDGYADIDEWHDNASVIYPAHEHDGDTAHIVVGGSIFITMSGEEKEYHPGNRFDIPAHVSHTVRMGDEGCTYIFGEKV
ncbi:MAG: hypothetical protein AAB473_03840 [Patescibacteria group bacterium]